MQVNSVTFRQVSVDPHKRYVVHAQTTKDALVISSVVRSVGRLNVYNLVMEDAPLGQRVMREAVSLTQGLATLAQVHVEATRPTV